MPNPKGLDKTAIVQEFRNQIGEEYYYDIPFEFAEVKLTGKYADYFKTDNTWSANLIIQTDYKDKTHTPYVHILLSPDSFAFAKDFETESFQMTLYLLDKTGKMIDNFQTF